MIVPSAVEPSGTIGEGVGLDVELDVGASAWSTWSVVVGVEEGTDIDQRIGTAPRRVAGIGTVPTGGATDCLLELHRTGRIEHEPANQTIAGACRAQLTVGFDRLGQLDERLGTLTPYPSGLLGVGHRQ